MNALKSILKLLPGGRELAERHSYKRRTRMLERIGDSEARFTKIYRENSWNDAESVSGAGSSLKTTAKLRAALPRLFEDLGVTTIFDAPCGDYNWFRHIVRDGHTRYIGGDIVNSLIQSNSISFEDGATRFIHSDITKDAFPKADIWLCRDCLVHLSFADIQLAIDNFLRSDIPYWLTTTHSEVDRNIDIPTGHWRMLNLEIEPLSFPKPVRYIEDDDHEDTGKRLGLWKRDQLREYLPS